MAQKDIRVITATGEACTLYEEGCYVVAAKFTYSDDPEGRYPVYLRVANFGDRQSDAREYTSAVNAGKVGKADVQRMALGYDPARRYRATASCRAQAV